MSVQEVRVERLLGREVHDPGGRRVGRVEEIVVDREGDEYVVREYLLGSAAFFIRLFRQLRVIGTKEHQLTGYRARWDQVDISDPARPRLTCAAEQLRRL
jgi:sporulation protein YlmC with PRC-barrel domain